jgi:dephospho-CoA kinase
MFVLGLTGSIGMGKSTVASMLSNDSAVPVLDADAVVHALYAPGGAAVAPVGALFPSAVVDGGVDRAALSKAVVGDAAALAALEAAVHPLVAAERRAWLARQEAAGAPLVVLDVPLLYETDGDAGVDAVVVVSAPADVQRARVLARGGTMTEAKLDAILARQVPDAVKRQRADFVIETGVPLEETREAVRALVAGLVGREGSGGWREAA